MMNILRVVLESQPLFVSCLQYFRYQQAGCKIAGVKLNVRLSWSSDPKLKPGTPPEDWHSQEIC